MVSLPSAVSASRMGSRAATRPTRTSPTISDFSPTIRPHRSSPCLSRRCADRTPSRQRLARRREPASPSSHSPWAIRRPAERRRRRIRADWLARAKRSMRYATSWPSCGWTEPTRSSSWASSPRARAARLVQASPPCRCQAACAGYWSIVRIITAAIASPEQSGGNEQGGPGNTHPAPLEAQIWAREDRIGTSVCGSVIRSPRRRG